jgi:hypothetical protein
MKLEIIVCVLLCSIIILAQPLPTNNTETFYTTENTTDIVNTTIVRNGKIKNPDNVPKTVLWLCLGCLALMLIACAGFGSAN